MLGQNLNGTESRALKSSSVNSVFAGQFKHCLVPFQSQPM